MGVSGVKLNPLGNGLIALFIGGIVVYAIIWSGVFRTSSEEINMAELLSVSIDLAKLGGAQVRIERQSNGTMAEISKGKTLEGVKDVATSGDMKSHMAMYYGFVKSFPNIKVISEEHLQYDVDTRGVQMPQKHLAEVQSTLQGIKLMERLPAEDLTVWIDPLDATKEYTENLLEYVTTMACVALKGRPIIGVIHWPFSGNTVWACVDAGTSAGLMEAERRKDDQTKVIISRSHSGDVTQLITDALGAKSSVTTAGGAGFKIANVVSGAVDAYVHMTRIKKWDLCAGAAILRAVGGNISTLDGTTIDFSSAGSAINENGVLATKYGRESHERFLGPLKSAFTKYRKSVK